MVKAKADLDLCRKRQTSMSHLRTSWNSCHGQDLLGKIVEAARAARRKCEEVFPRDFACGVGEGAGPEITRRYGELREALQSFQDLGGLDFKDLFSNPPLLTIWKTILLVLPNSFSSSACDGGGMIGRSL